MFVSFEPLVFLVWLFITTFIPGAILSFSVFRKDGFTVLERLMIGFALGFVILPFIPFLMYFILGVKFTYTIALVSVALLYAIALAFFVKNKAYEGLSLPKPTIKVTLSKELVIACFLILLLLVNYLIRISSYSPVFQELDPYYYTYTAQQVLTLGHNPVNDSTSWYPEVTVDHRAIPNISYLESVWYMFYFSGGAYDNMSLALIASMYPPLAAVFAVFFIYLLVSSATGKREWGLVAAGLASFIPVFVYKLAAGEEEVQPYAFFAITFFYSMFLLALRRKDIRIPSMSDLSPGPDIKYPVLAGLAFAALSLGSSSQILALASVIIFIGIQAVLFFLRDDDNRELRHLIMASFIMFAIGPLLGGAVVKALFETGGLSFSIAAGVLSAIIFAGVLYALKEKLHDRQQAMLALGIILVLGLLVYAATPVGDYIRNLGKAGFEIAQFNRPLDRTIAEQGLAPLEFSGTMGFIAQSYSIPPVLDSFGSIVNMLLFILLIPFSIASNLILGVFVGLVNLALGTSVEWTDKTVSQMLFWVFLLLSSAVYCGWRFMKKEDDSQFVLFLAMILPPLAVGLVKAKYSIYSAVLLAIGIGFALAQVENAIPVLLKDEKERRKAIGMLLLVGGFMVAMQFLFQGFAPSLLWGSFQTLYQNDPQALAAKFQQICSSTKDAEVCAAAADPLGYAANGTNSQYSYKLCLLSMFSSPQSLANPNLAPPWEAQAAYFRCQRISDYWIDSMEWIKKNTEPGARIMSWWDYGHWINYFGDRNAVIRNEHMSTAMIGAVAHGYIDATPDQLISWMKAHDARYALFDIELISGGGSLGGKYGALNYLSCAYDNQTTVAQLPGESRCEADHLWETVYISQTPCTVSSLTNRTGFTAYKIFAGDNYMPSYPEFCINPQDANAMAYCRDVIRAVPVYCAAETTLADGQKALATYYLNQTYPNGDLRLNKGILQLPQQIPSTPQMGPVTSATIFYTKDPIWIENGEVKSGYEDRKGKFYDSAMYKAIFLGELPGFSLVYSTPNGGAVKIYKLNG